MYIYIYIYIVSRHRPANNHTIKQDNNKTQRNKFNDN